MPESRLSQISRRQFHREVSAVTVGAISTGVARGQSPSSEKKYPAGKYVDIHVHLGQEWNSRGPLTAEMMLRWMDAHEIAQACILPLINPEAWFYPITPAFVLQQTKPYRDRLIPFCAVDPRSVNLGGYNGIVDILKRYIDAGAKGFGEHKPGIPMDDPRNLELYRACGDLGLAVVFHLDHLRNTDGPGLPGLEKVLREVPKVKMIGHAHGFWCSISGDATKVDFNRYPKTPVALGGALDRLMEKYPNLYGDLSAGSGHNAIARDLKFGREFVIRRADQLLFGTDYLANGQDVPQFDLYDQMGLPADVQAKVFRDNARGLWLD